MVESLLGLVNYYESGFFLTRISFAYDIECAHLYGKVHL